MMTIAFDAKRLFYNHTGLGQYSREIVRGLLNMESSVNCQLLAHHKKPSDYDDEFLQYLYPTEHYGPLWRSWGIYKSINALRPDVYHGLSNELPFSIHQYKVPSVVTIHDVIFKVHPEWYPFIDRQIYDKKTAWACQNADKIIAISNQTKQDLIQFYAVPADKIEVIYQDCAPIFSKTFNAEFITGVRSQYHLPRHYVLTVGRIEKRKNLLLTAQALKYLPSDIHWVCVGRDHGEKEVILEILKKDGTHNRVLFLQNIPQKDLVVMYQQALAFIYLSLYEGFGIPVLEGMRAGVPVITYQHSSLSEVAGEQGLYLEQLESEELADIVHKIYSDVDFRQTIIHHQYYQASLFSKETMIKETIAIYRSLSQQ